MGKKAVEESVLDEYLKNNLGFSKGINTTLTNPDEPAGEQAKTIKEWIGYGSVKEDDLIPRPPLLAPRVVAHFYDPVSNQGLHNIYINSLEFGESFESNLYSWSKAREYYYLALTSPTKEERDKYWALTFRALGQVLHLVQDLASPAHVRNDNHLPIGDNADPYEETWGTSPEGVSFIHGALDNPDYQYPVVELDQFDDYWDTEDGQGLAEFTNSNFVSKDTNVDVLTGSHHYDNPQPTGLHREPFEFTDSNNVRRTVNVTYYTSNVVDSYAPGRSVNPFNYLTAVSPWNFYTGRYDPDRIHYTLNRKCHEEYAKLLVPRTVGYGAGLLNYFFRGELEVDVLPADDAQQLRFVVTNNADKNLQGGSLSLYVIEKSEEYILLRTDMVDISSGMSYELVEHARGINTKGYLLVYTGGIFGTEVLENNQAVVAKSVWVYPIYADCWVSTGNVYSNFQFHSTPDGAQYYIEIMNLEFEEISFVKINIESIYGSVKKARLFYLGQGALGTFNVFSTNPDWEEYDPTYILQPVTISYLTSSYDPGTGYISWNITDYVRNVKVLGEDYISLKMTANYGSVGSYQAREHQTPFLLIEYGEATED